ncbi:hypothetical protein [Chitinophaga japonensis]|uniref:DUF1735 domain-containing protein n=1 Tax=Chitinophaga japonensis TaxID=104662 RepID=A0A562TE88_CHIJA|nr:hypothetical protein [Chitinophaga japonensis]TWI91406.1 hypothetical protein LX66_0775 [Chitinophaga japonensis]
MKNILKIFLLVAGVFSLAACDKDFTDDIVRDNKPEIPVTFEGATTSGFNPYYTVQYNGGNATFSFNITIPSNARLKIKEVTKAIAGSTALTVTGLNTSSTPSYLDGAVSVGGTSVTITTSIAEFNSKASPAITGAPAAGSSFEERAFYFLLTMDDDSQIVPVQCRIRVMPD